ncbi:hypothetical protein PVK06_012179 [Gossypium arboreum]|uniref:Uncharacterized protein n=1 Tax=Gossypium arboreum TaxID=29729 RepID=A0ABR0QBR0_GOSAR|nr:hypothetical protein PVK06_012179 [Gossypium arboreum]
MTKSIIVKIIDIYNPSYLKEYSIIIKGISLVNWETLCRGTNEGGIGFRNMAQMHNSFLVKNGYMLVARTNQLWVQVVRAKYKVDSQIQRFFILEMALGYGKVYARFGARFEMELFGF